MLDHRWCTWFGLDRWVLPALGTPWEPGTMVRQEREVEQHGGGRGPAATG